MGHRKRQFSAWLVKLGVPEVQEAGRLEAAALG